MLFENRILEKCRKCNRKKANFSKNLKYYKFGYNSPLLIPVMLPNHLTEHKNKSISWHKKTGSNHKVSARSPIFF